MTYYLKSSGAMATGWQQIGGSWYYFTSGGSMVSKAWQGNYYLDKDGKMITYAYIHSTLAGKYYWVDKSGAYVSKYTTTKKSDTSGYKVYNETNGELEEE